mgnify:FL=1
MDIHRHSPSCMSQDFANPKFTIAIYACKVYDIDDKLVECDV